MKVCMLRKLYKKELFYLLKDLKEEKLDLVFEKSNSLERTIKISY